MGTVFFSWQSDLNRKFNKNFIFNCLKKSIREINKEIQFLEPERGEPSLLEADQDTQDIPGHPDIFSTILTKIDKSDVFIPDFSLVAESKDGKKIPNPNVMIEYGYALKALGANRIVPIMNTHYGDFNSLPFDLRTKRAPIPYCLPDDADEETIARERKNLIINLTKSIRLTTANFQEQAPNPTLDINALISKYVHPLSTHTHMMEQDSNGGMKQFSGMFAIINPSGKWEDDKVAIREKLQYLQPFGEKLSRYRTYRWHDSVEIYQGLEQKENATRKSFTKLFHNGTIFGFDKIYSPFSDEILRLRNCRGILFPDYIEEHIREGLRNYLTFYKSYTSFSLPIHIVVGLYNIYDFRIALPAGPQEDSLSENILDGTITHTFEVNRYDADLEGLLLPLFEKIWLEAGMRRPADLMRSIKHGTFMPVYTLAALERS